MDKSQTEKQAAMREAEKQRYLAGLKSRQADRTKSQEQLKQSEQIRAQKAADEAQAYLEKMGSRSEFRDGVKDKMISDSKENQELMDQVGQEYRGKLQWFASRHALKPGDIDRLLDKEDETSS